MEDFINLIIFKADARKIYNEGIKSKDTVKLLLAALKDPDGTFEAAKNNQTGIPLEEYASISLHIPFANQWIRTLENLPEIVDQVLAAYLRGAFAVALGVKPEIDNNWTLTE